MVSVNKISWQVAELQPRVFELIHLGVEVEVFDVYLRELCAWRGHNAVEQKFEGEADPCRSFFVSRNVSFETLRECVQDTIPYRLHNISRSASA